MLSRCSGSARVMWLGSAGCRGINRSCHNPQTAWGRKKSMIDRWEMRKNRLLWLDTTRQYREWATHKRFATRVGEMFVGRLIERMQWRAEVEREAHR